MKVLLLNQVFWPDTAATAQHGHDLARYLVSQGDSVTAVASRSIYGDKGSSLPARDSVDGIEIHRVGRSLFGKKSTLGRAADFVLFYIAATFRVLTLPKHDVVVCFTTPPFISAVGLLLRLFRGTRTVVWLMDMYPDVPVAAGMMRAGSLSHRFFEWLDRRILRNSDAVVVLGRCMAERVRAKGVDPARMHLVNVWSDPNEIRVLPRSENPYRAEWSIGERFVVQYSGNFGIGHDMTAMCDAMRRLAGDDRIRWVMVGGGVRKKEVERAISEGGIPNAVVAAHQPRARLGELLALGDAHLVTIAPGFEGTLVPSKFYGVLAAAKPTLYVGPATSEVARTVDERRAGVAVAVGDGKALAEAILAMVEDRAEALAMGERGRRATEQELGIAFACAKWRAILADVVAGRRRN